jgi:hypothetical protein
MKVAGSAEESARMAGGRWRAAQESTRSEWNDIARRVFDDRAARPADGLSTSTVHSIETFSRELSRLLAALYAEE